MDVAFYFLKLLNISNMHAKIMIVVELQRPYGPGPWQMNNNWSLLSCFDAPFFLYVLLSCPYLQAVNLTRNLKFLTETTYVYINVTERKTLNLPLP